MCWERGRCRSMRARAAPRRSPAPALHMPSAACQRPSSRHPRAHATRSMPSPAPPCPPAARKRLPQACTRRQRDVALHARRQQPASPVGTAASHYTSASPRTRQQRNVALHPQRQHLRHVLGVAAPPLDLDLLGTGRSGGWVCGSYSAACTCRLPQPRRLTLACRGSGVGAAVDAAAGAQQQLRPFLLHANPCQASRGGLQQPTNQCTHLRVVVHTVRVGQQAAPRDGKARPTARVLALALPGLRVQGKAEDRRRAGFSRSPACGAPAAAACAARAAGGAARARAPAPRQQPCSAAPPHARPRHGHAAAARRKAGGGGGRGGEGGTRGGADRSWGAPARSWARSAR